MHVKSFLGNRWVRALVGAGLLSLSSLGQAGVLVMEPGDAGDSLATATVIGAAGAVDVRGMLTSSDLVDIFAVYLHTGAAFSATTTLSGIAFNNFDTSLFLFDASGAKVAENDDDLAVGPQSTLTYSPAAAGTYYLAITGTGMTPSGSVPTWSGFTSEYDAYEVVMNGVPEPTSLALAALALGGAGLARQRRRA